jgi:hypothetical protein
MVAEAFATLSALKTAFDMAKGLKDINDATVRNAAIIELQERILAAQAAQSTLIEHVRELETEVARLEAWETEKQKYELTDVGNGSLAFALKEEAASGAIPHYLCANCYNEGHPSYLQKQERPHRRQALHCQRCGSDIWPWGGGGDDPPRVNRGSGSSTRRNWR